MNDDDRDDEIACPECGVVCMIVNRAATEAYHNSQP